MSGEIALTTLWTLSLAGVRMLALFSAAPVFSHASVPVRVRVGLSVVATWACSSQLVPVSSVPIDLPLVALAAIVGELLVGVTLGFALRLVFAGFALLGEFISVQGGLGAATVLDPTSGSSAVVLTSLMQFVGLAVFLAVDGHHAVLRALVDSFGPLPPGAAGMTPERFAAVVALGGVIFEIATRLAAPVTVMMLVSNVAVGILGRSIPQLNLMALQLPAHIAMTLLVIGFGAGALTRSMGELLDDFSQGLLGRVLGGG